MRLPGSLLIALSLFILSLTASAADGVYEIELVIFTQPADGDSESFPDSPELPDFTAASVLLDADTPGNGAAANGIQFLPRREGRLGPAVYTLDRKGAQVLAHLRWRQAIPRDADNPWYRIGNGELDGLIRLNRGRFIHLHTDLMFTQAGRSYRIRERARARSGELHYVDHPRLGILFRADRYQDPNALTEAEAGTTLPEETEPAQPDNPPEQRAPAGELPRAMPDPS